MTKNSLFCPFYLLMFLFASTLLANAPNADKKALYALFSLNYYLEDQLCDSLKAQNETRINFDEVDISLLWQRASRPGLEPQIQQAKIYYDNSFDSCDNNRLENLIQAKFLIENAWNQINPYTQTVIPKSPESHRFILKDTNWLKKHLDQIFSKFDASQNEDTFKQAGFKLI